MITRIELNYTGNLEKNGVFLSIKNHNNEVSVVNIEFQKLFKAVWESINMDNDATCRIESCDFLLYEQDGPQG